jgi:secondary thiamine-phosphate synthase enzyme
MKPVIITTTKPKQVIDITEIVNEKLPSSASICHLFSMHTTCALTCADLDPGTDLDLLDAFAAMVPKLNYRHPHDPGHVPDHILSALIGVSLTLPVRNGQLLLGRWQRVVMFEFDGPRERQLTIRTIS